MSTEVDAAADPEAGRRAALADRAGWAGIDTRYAREWLEQQAVAGFLDVEPAGDADPGQAAGEDWETRRYRLPDPHADVLLDADHPAHAGAAAYWAGSLADVRLAIAVRQRPGRLVRGHPRAPGPPGRRGPAPGRRGRGGRPGPGQHLFWRFYELRG